MLHGVEPNPLPIIETPAPAAPELGATELIIGCAKLLKAINKEEINKSLLGFSFLRIAFAAHKSKLVLDVISKAVFELNLVPVI